MVILADRRLSTLPGRLTYLGADIAIDSRFRDGNFRHTKPGTCGNTVNDGATGAFLDQLEATA